MVMFQVDPGLRDGDGRETGKAALLPCRRRPPFLYRRSKRQKDSPGGWPGEGQEKTMERIVHAWGQHQAPVSELAGAPDDSDTFDGGVCARARGPIAQRIL